MSGSAPPLEVCRGCRARAWWYYGPLACSLQRGSDDPLSPAPLDDELGPAAGFSGDYPGGTHTSFVWSSPVVRTQQVLLLGNGHEANQIRETRAARYPP